MKHILPILPYEYNALEPYIDAKTMEIHYTKHHQAYVDNLNRALDKYPELFKKKIEEILGNLNKIPEDIKTPVINHGGGHYNHSLFWELMTGEKNKNKFQGKIAEEIKKEFGDFEKFKELFSDCAMKRFGSGWAWLVYNLKNGKLEMYSTSNQDSPVTENKIPLLGLDVWEHAYYLKYQNKRNEYVNNWWNVVNWDKVNELYMEIKK